MLLRLRQVQGAGNNKGVNKDEENKVSEKKDMYGDKIPFKTKEATRYVLYESQP
jgi:hypothetical protein